MAKAMYKNESINESPNYICTTVRVLSLCARACFSGVGKRVGEKVTPAGFL